MSEQRENKRTWTETIEVAGNELVEKIKELIEEGNVRRIIIRRPTGEVIIEIPLTAGIAVTGVLTVFAPVLAAITAIAALVAQVKVEIVREEKEEKKEEEKEEK